MRTRRHRAIMWAENGRKRKNIKKRNSYTVKITYNKNTVNNLIEVINDFRRTVINFKRNLNKSFENIKKGIKHEIKANKTSTP